MGKSVAMQFYMGLVCLALQGKGLQSENYMVTNWNKSQKSFKANKLLFQQSRIRINQASVERMLKNISQHLSKIIIIKQFSSCHSQVQYVPNFIEK